MGQNPWGMLAQQSNEIAPFTSAPAPSQGANGYMGYSDYSQPQNPYAGIISQGQQMLGMDQGAVNQGMGQANQNLQSLYSQQNQMNNQYPSYPNPYGLGSQQPYQAQSTPAPIPGSASNPNYGAGPLTNNAALTDSSARGFNPWSLTGESNARSSH